MTRPAHLTNVVTGRHSQDYQSLTPRTPHSRSGRAEEGFTDIELEEIDQEGDDYRAYAQQQSVPLLASSTSGGFSPTGYRSRGDDYGETVTRASTFKGLTLELICSRLPLVFGSAIAMFLLILTLVAVRQPEILQDYVGDTSDAYANDADDSFIVPGDADTPIPTTQLDAEHTISYENYTTFPLTGKEYLAECQKLNRGFMAHGNYWDASAHGTMDVPHVANDHDYGLPLPEGELTKICDSTIIYQLDGNVGLLSDLALMAQAAALARERNRTFLVDDTYWNRGKWTDHFQDVRSRQPGPEPGCRAPPPQELVACPRLARHWVINSRTAKFHFGNGFSDKYEDPYSHSLNRLKPIFQFALTSFEETIRPNAHIAGLIRSTRTEMAKLLLSPTGARTSGKDTPTKRAESHAPSYIGIHVRRGDQRATSWAFHNGFVPIANYVQATLDTWSRLFPSSSASTVYIASDSPSALNELAKDFPPNTSIFSLSRSTDPELRALASKRPYVQKEFAGLDEEERINATKGMIVDFSMVNGMWKWKDDVVPEATICTIRSSVCKLSAVGLGWDRAFGKINDMGEIDEKGKRWVEIDNRDTVMPIWEAFPLFF